MSYVAAKIQGGIIKNPYKSTICRDFAFRCLLLTYLLAVRTGLEPATSAVTGRHSNQLNYRTNFELLGIVF